MLPALSSLTPILSINYINEELSERVHSPEGSVIPKLMARTCSQASSDRRQELLQQLECHLALPGLSSSLMISGCLPSSHNIS